MKGTDVIFKQIEILVPSINKQVFKTTIGDRNNIALAKEQHKKAISNAIVYSREHTIRSATGGELYCISGFVERMGRLPMEGDVILIHWGQHKMSDMGDCILSELNFSIISTASKTMFDYTYDTDEIYIH